MMKDEVLKAKNCIDEGIRLEVKKYTRQIVAVLCSERYGYTAGDIAAALELKSSRTVADWAKNTKGPLTQIPTKQSFLQICLIKLQIDYIPEDQRKEIRPSVILKYAAIPILVNSALRSGPSRVLGGIFGEALGTAIGAPGLGGLTLGPVGLLIGVSALTEFQR